MEMSLDSDTHVETVIMMTYCGDKGE